MSRKRTLSKDFCTEGGIFTYQRLLYSMRISINRRNCIFYLLASFVYVSGCFGPEQSIGHESNMNHVNEASDSYASAQVYFDQGEVISLRGDLAIDDCVDGTCQMRLQRPDSKNGRTPNRLGVMLEYTHESVEAAAIEASWFDGRTTTPTHVLETYRQDAFAIYVIDFAETHSTQLRIVQDVLDRSNTRSIEFEWLWVPKLRSENTSTSQTALVSGIGVKQQAVGYTGMTTREQWGATPRRCDSEDIVKNKVAIHHTATPTRSGGDSAARVRAIQSFHMDVRQWCDVGYHFLVADDGEVFEGRELDQRGAHVRNHNAGNIGIAMLGCFDSTESSCQSPGYNDPIEPTTSTLDSVSDLIADFSNLYLIDVNTVTVKGHGQHDGHDTSCPGNQAVPLLDSIRSTAITKATQGATGENGIIKGFVYDNSIAERSSDATQESGALLGDARVLLGNGAILHTDPFSGVFEIEVFPGVYYLTISHPGFRTETVQVQVGGGETVWANTGLTPLPPGEQFAHLIFDIFASSDQSLKINGAQISLMPIGQSDLEQVLFTDVNGRKEVDIQTGDWIITVNAGGYSETSQTFFFEGREYNVEVGLVEERGDEGNDYGSLIDPSEDEVDYEDIIRVTESSGCQELKSEFGLLASILICICVRRRQAIATSLH